MFASSTASASGLGEDAPKGRENASETNNVVETTVDDIPDGGHLRVGTGVNIQSFDWPYSIGGATAVAQSLVFESLTTSSAEGELAPWLAEDWEIVDVNDITRSDYEPYMSTFEAREDGSLSHGEQEIIRHPDDQLPEEGDEVRVLLWDDAAEAVDDGTYGMYFRYDLREGVEFHDETELTADDVVASYDRIKLSHDADHYFDLTLYYEVVDDYTVDIYAQIPDAEAARNLPPEGILTEEQANLPDGDLDPREGHDPVGTGPYVFVDIEDNQYVEYEKFDDYWVEKQGIDSIDWFDGDAEEFPDGPVVEEVTLEIIPDAPTRSEALEAGEIDVTTGLTRESLDNFEESEDFYVTQTETGRYEWFSYPIQVEPYDDQRFRQALNHLVPRQEIVDDIFAGWGRPAWTMLPELASVPGTQDPDALEDEVRHLNEYDVDQAEVLIEDVFEDHDIEPPMEIKLEVDTGSPDRISMVELYADKLEQTGYFEVEVETFTWFTWFDRVLDSEYAEKGNIACLGLSGSFSPHSYCEGLHHSDAWGQCCNVNGVAFEWLDGMLDEARYGMDVLEDPDYRREVYDDIWVELEELAANAITHFDLQTSVFSERVNDWSQYPFHEGYLRYALYNPMEGRVAYMTPEESPIEEPPIEDYTNEDGIVDPPGVLEAIDDWREDKIDTPLVLEVIEAWRSGEPVE